MRTLARAFRAIRARGAGLGIVVQEVAAPTAAHVRLEDPEAVRRVLDELERALPEEEVLPDAGH